MVYCSTYNSLCHVYNGGKNVIEEMKNVLNVQVEHERKGNRLTTVYYRVGAKTFLAA